MEVTQLFQPKRWCLPKPKPKIWLCLESHTNEFFILTMMSKWGYSYCSESCFFFFFFKCHSILFLFHHRLHLCMVNQLFRFQIWCSLRKLMPDWKNAPLLLEMSSSKTASQLLSLQTTLTPQPLQPMQQMTSSHFCLHHIYSVHFTFVSKKKKIYIYQQQWHNMKNVCVLCCGNIYSC